MNRENATPAMSPDSWNLGTYVRRLLMVVPLISLALMAQLTTAAEAAGQGDARPHISSANSFCGAPTIRDYEQPLEGLPPVEGLPESGQLPFGPSGLRVTFLKPSRLRLLFAGTTASFQLSNVSAPDTSQLEWTIKTALWRAGQGGAISPPVSESTVQVDVLPAHGSLVAIEAGTLGGPDSYRVDIAFLDASGTMLGSYSEYVRAVAPTTKARLGINRRSVGPGGNLKMRVENVGTRELQYGAPFQLERREADRWVKLPSEGPFFASRSGAAAGMAGECQVVHIPRHAPPGSYRIRKVVHAAGSPHHRRVAVTATFRVRRCGSGRTES